MTSFRPAASPDHWGRVVADEDPQHQEGEGDPDQGKAEGHFHQGGVDEQSKADEGKKCEQSGVTFKKGAD